MDCTKCGTWNPDDKTVCWRCQAELPRPKPKEQPRKPFLGLQPWMWILLAVLIGFTFFSQCVLFTGAPPAG